MCLLLTSQGLGSFWGWRNSREVWGGSKGGVCVRMKGGCSGEYFCITGNSSSIPGQQSHENCHSLHTRLPEIPRLLIGPFILILAAMACTDPSSHTNLAYTHTGDLPAQSHAKQEETFGDITRFPAILIITTTCDQCKNITSLVFL